MSFFTITFIAALIADRLFGDPECAPHPIRWIGRLITRTEKLLRKGGRATPGIERLRGAALTAVVVAVVYLLSILLLYLAHRLWTPLFYTLTIYMIWASISIKGLEKEARGILKSLRRHGLEGDLGARKRLARIVGRDTEELDTEGLFRATTESVAENTSDGVIAPLFYLAIGGPALMLSYKAVNTLDSMCGYKDERYIDFGLVPARLDDVLNYIPARLSAALTVLAAFILGYDWRGSLATAWRDGRKHPSPNAGVVEAAVAGALGVRLGGPASYGGVLTEKPYIGNGPKAPDEGAVLSSIRLMLTSTGLMCALVLFSRAVVIGLL
jgi:adenosylcobinamide-phosphate synthase